MLYVGGFLLASGITGRELAEVFRQARTAGVKTVLDVVVPGKGDHWNQVAAVLPHTDVFLPNEDEGLAITGLKSPREQAEKFLAAGAGTVVITCGGSGTYLLSRELRLKAGIFTQPFVSGTGAGDAFDAGTSPLFCADTARASAWPGEPRSAAVAFAPPAPPRACSPAPRRKNFCEPIRSKSSLCKS